MFLIAGSFVVFFHAWHHLMIVCNVFMFSLHCCIFLSVLVMSGKFGNCCVILDHFWPTHESVASFIPATVSRRPEGVRS